MIEQINSFGIGSFMSSEPLNFLVMVVIAIAVLFITLKVAKPLIGGVIIVVVGLLGLLLLEMLLVELGYDQIASVVNFITQVIHYVLELFIYALEYLLDLLFNYSEENMDT